LVGSGTLLDGELAIEVLPKLYANSSRPDAQKEAEARAGLFRIWQVAEGVSTNEHEAAGGLESVSDAALHEWLAERFLNEVEALLQRGVRMQYVEREDNQKFLRGRLLPAENLRVNVVAPYRFFCRFEEMSPDRPENRLIRAALQCVENWTSAPSTRRRASSLGDRLREVPPSRQICRDFAAWKDDRLMTNYRALRHSCSWILHEKMPAPVRGEQQMFGCFARMHKVFERYVENWLVSCLRHRLGDLKLQSHQRRVFCRQKGGAGSEETMIPDMLIYKHDRLVGVLDSKWKETGKNLEEHKLGRADLFQMVAYAQFWLREVSSVGTEPRLLGLIYPSLEPEPGLLQFEFEEPIRHIRLRAFGFCLPRYQPDGRSEGSEGLKIEALIDALGLGAGAEVGSGAGQRNRAERQDALRV
jgi:5-methylcytosine-specific restriction enzyme subunit McrC